MNARTVILQLFGLFLIVYTASTEIQCTKEELTQRLKYLFGGKGALSDFLFYNVEDLRNSSNNQIRPRNQLPNQIPQLKNNNTRTNNNTITDKATERILLRTVDMLRKGENAELIKGWTLQLLRILGNGGKQPLPAFYYKPQINFEINLPGNNHKHHKKASKHRRRQKTHNNNNNNKFRLKRRKNRIEKLRRIRENRNNRRHRFGGGNKQRKRWFFNSGKPLDVVETYHDDRTNNAGIFDVNTEDSDMLDEEVLNNNLDEEDFENLIIKNEMEKEDEEERFAKDFYDTIDNDDEKNLHNDGNDENIAPELHRLEDHQDRVKESHDDKNENIIQKLLHTHEIFDPIKHVSPVQDYDFQRMRRAASFKTTGERTCDPEGHKIDNTVLLCTTCDNTVDFGLTVVPQFAKSIECDSAALKCLGGFGGENNGFCMQKVVYFTFHKQIRTTDRWERFQQPLNVSCECQCNYNSLVHRAFVGSSN